MADLDTRNKRGSAIGYKAFGRQIFPNPDADITGQADRQQIAAEYPGILAAAGTTYTPRLPLLGVG